jgi:hypothetical protein
LGDIVEMQVKNKIKINYYTVGTVPKSNRKIVEKGE